jgi:polyisoprenyl-teichoic acid--peptidoglycan teichoic acid transferase
MYMDLLARRFDRRKLLEGWVGAMLLGGIAAPFRGLRVASAASSDVQPANLGVLTIVAGGLDSRKPGEPENSDVLKICRVDVPNRTLRVISLPRDLYVDIPGFSPDKITRAYDFGSKADNGSFKAGAKTIRDTIEANFGVEVHGAVLTTFGGFEEVVDAFGGVDVNNPYDVADGEYPTTDYGVKSIYYPAGDIHLNGEEALEFSRTRHQDGDDGRVMRQELVIRGLLERSKDPDFEPNLTDLVNTHRKAIRTDLGKSKQLALALAAPDFSNDNVSFTTLANYIYGDYAGDMWIYSGDWNQIPGYVQGFLDGSIS